MPLPALQRTWIIDPNNRIPFTSLVQTMRDYLFQIKEFLKLNGYTVRGSSDGITAAMDGPTDRWVTAANAGIRGTVAAAAQSWIILRDGNGVDILMTYQGAGVTPTGDDIARFSFSAGQLFVLAGTATHQPTATDERVITSALTVIGPTASGDRLWNGWVDSTSKLCRFALIRANSLIGTAWGVEEVDPAVAGGTTWVPPVWGFALASTSSYINNGTTAGQAKPTVGGSPTTPAVVFGAEQIANTYTSISGVKPELQGSVGFPMFPLVIGSVTGGTAGKLGNLYDWWLGRTTGQLLGDVYGDLEFIHICPAFSSTTTPGGIWPWDGVTEPLLV